jgi:anti-sigma factor RsiW
MSCRDALPLVPGYLDGELSEEQAAPLRRHLLDCPGCREAVKSERNLKLWFDAPEAAALPVGFGARVARLAFAKESLPDRVLVPTPARRGEPAALETRASRTDSAERILPFVLGLTAAAAVLILILAVALRSIDRPDTVDLRADSEAPPRPRAELFEAIRRLERADADASPVLHVPAPEKRQR